MITKNEVQSVIDQYEIDKPKQNEHKLLNLSQAYLEIIKGMAINFYQKTDIDKLQSLMKANNIDQDELKQWIDEKVGEAKFMGRLNNRELKAKVNKVVFKRRLFGAYLVDFDHSNRILFNLKEKAVHGLELQNNDVLTINPDRVDGNGFPEVVKVEKLMVDDNNIEELHYGIVMFDDGGEPYVNVNLDGERLSNINPVMTKCELSRLTKNKRLHDGDLVDLAWNKLSPDNIKLRWIYSG